MEAVAELNDFVRAAAKSFKNIMPEQIRVVLLHAGAVILPELPESLGRFAQDLLMKRGVEIRFDTRLQGATADAALLAGGERIATRTLVSTVPSGPNPLVAALPCRKDRGRIVADAHLECLATRASGPWATAPTSSTAERARRARRPRSTPCARPAASPRTSWRACAGPRSARFAFKALGKMGALGHRSAVAEVFGVKLSGFSRGGSGGRSIS